ncbi:MAG TPA: hypothetical protein VHR88_04545 [Solirubrobacteraceae bacterium]|jgi:hypothetical protein|nr:hypothetical protein [Solirubrobacteraceae bacterium]
MADDTKDKGTWAQTADDGIVPDPEAVPADPELGSEVTGQTTGTDAPTTEEGIDRRAGDHADAVTDGGQNPPEGAEPDLKDAPAAAVQPDDA